MHDGMHEFLAREDRAIQRTRHVAHTARDIEIDMHFRTLHANSTHVNFAMEQHWTSAEGSLHQRSSIGLRDWTHHSDDITMHMWNASNAL